MRTATSAVPEEKNNHLRSFVPDTREIRELALLTWGLRPRLYSATCFAGSGQNMLSGTASQVPGKTMLSVTASQVRANMLSVTASQVPGKTGLALLLRRELSVSLKCADML
jgi:hypothetical protein